MLNYLKSFKLSIYLIFVFQIVTGFSEQSIEREISNA